jgi:type II secretory pathway component PulF
MVASSKSTAVDALASAARQLQYALEDSGTTDQAFQKLYAVVDPQQRATLQQLEVMLRSPESDATTSKSLRLSPFPTLAWLLRQTMAPERSAAALFSEFRRHQSFSATGTAVVWSEFAGFLTYLGAVLGVLIVVTVMYGVFVLPQFQMLYRGFGQELPALTSAVFGHGAPWFTFMVMLATALLVFLSWFVFYLRRQLRRYSPMPTGYQKVPLVGPVAVAYNRYLWISYAGLLRAASMPADQALGVAGTRLPLLDLGQWSVPVGEPSVHGERAASGLTSDLSIAARLGKLEEEAQFQQEATGDAFLTALVRCRRRARTMLTILTYYLVATFVSGMYLPIFSLGSVI